MGNFEELFSFKDKKVLVIGLGKSGVSSVKKLSTFNCSVTAIDTNPLLNIEREFTSIKKKEGFSLELVLDVNINSNTEILKDIDLVILSPGVSNEIPLIKFADKLGLPVWSEIEFAWRFLDEPGKKNTIAVTGTNGKTTVVTIIQKILEHSKKNSVVCGNIGFPLIDTVDSKYPEDLIRVIEISSFQLERTYSFNPFAAIILNITNDHLDRHFSMDNYADIKFRLFQKAGRNNWGIFNIDDHNTLKKLLEKNIQQKSGMNVIRYSIHRESGAEVYCKDKTVFYNIGELAGSINIASIYLAGNHNISNIMSAVSALKLFGIPDLKIEASLKKFKPLRHRIEFLGYVDGVRVFNDSKATNPDATIKALESFEREVTLILGGKDKEMDFNVLLPYLDKKIINLILIGETKLKILKMLKNHDKDISGLPYNTSVCSDFEEAVEKGLKLTEKGKVLLLSPACASFDMFKDYKDRGDKFRNIVFSKKGKLK